MTHKAMMTYVDISTDMIAVHLRRKYYIKIRYIFGFSVYLPL